MAMEDLSSVLWHERELLETLAYKLEVEQLVLAGGRTHWLAAAAREVENVLERIREIELLRAVEVEAVAEELGLAAERRACTRSRTRATSRGRASGSTTARRSPWSPPRSSSSPSRTASCSPPATTPHRPRCCRMTEDAGTYRADGAVDSGRRTSLLDRSL